MAGSRIVSTSGDDRLDQATLAALGQCQLVPTTLNGVPVPTTNWKEIRWNWNKTKTEYSAEKSDNKVPQ